MSNKSKFNLKVHGVELLLIYFALKLNNSNSLVNSILLAASVCNFLIIFLIDFCKLMFKNYFYKS